MATDLQLDEASRSKLDGIVQQMQANNEPDANIQTVVGDFKQKYAKPQDTSGAWFPSASTDSPVGAGFKAFGNTIPSAVSTAKNIVTAPYEIGKAALNAPSQIADLTKSSGGILPAMWNVAKEIPESTYKLLIPESARQAISGDYEGASKTMTNDPFGQIFQIYALLEGGTKLMDKYGGGLKIAEDFNKTNGIAEKPTQGVYSEGLDKAISTAGKAVIDTGSKVAGTPFDMMKSTARFGTAQATGLNPETVSQIVGNPEAFTKTAMAQTDRASLAQEVESALNKRIESLGETGKEYQGIRENPVQVPVKPTDLTNIIQETTGLTMKDGVLETSGSASIRNPSDISALQRKIVSVWQPEFEKGYLTSDEYLNFRSDLGKMAKYEGGIGKSADLENLADVMRGKTNTKYRPSIPGLEELDQKFGPQAQSLRELKKGIFDKDGNLNTNALNTITNATNRGRDLRLAQLEEISPGITQKIKVVKAIEDIQNTGGHKVGTYARATLGSGGAVASFLTGHLPATALFIAEMILASPDVAIPLIRAYGKAAGITETVIGLLRRYLQNANNFPAKMNAGQPQEKPMLALPAPGQSSSPTIFITPKGTAAMELPEALQRVLQENGQIKTPTGEPTPLQKEVPTPEKPTLALPSRGQTSSLPMFVTPKGTIAIELPEAIQQAMIENGIIKTPTGNPTPYQAPAEPRKLPIQSQPSEYNFYQKPSELPTIEMGKKAKPPKGNIPEISQGKIEPPQVNFELPERPRKNLKAKKKK